MGRSPLSGSYTTAPSHCCAVVELPTQHGSIELAGWSVNLVDRSKAGLSMVYAASWAKSDPRRIRHALSDARFTGCSWGPDSRLTVHCHSSRQSHGAMMNEVWGNGVALMEAYLFESLACGRPKVSRMVKNQKISSGLQDHFRLRKALENSRYIMKQYFNNFLFLVHHNLYLTNRANRATLALVTS